MPVNQGISGIARTRPVIDDMVERLVQHLRDSASPDAVLDVRIAAMMLMGIAHRVPLGPDSHVGPENAGEPSLETFLHLAAKAWDLAHDADVDDVPDWIARLRAAAKGGVVS